MLNEQLGEGQSIFRHTWIIRLSIAFLVVATIFVGIEAVHALRNIDVVDPSATNVITVSGEGKITAMPDIATITFTASGDAVTASAAQDAVTQKTNVAFAVLEELGIANEDIKTVSYNISPKYAYVPPCYAAYCPPQEQRVTGYTVSQTTEVKVREPGEKVGDVLAQLGDAGVSNLYGPNFTIENEDELRAEARKEAIDEARAKAKVLAKDLGVRLVRVVSFSEGGMYPMPYAYGLGGASADIATKATPQIPTGENEIAVQVSISYEIR